MDAKDVKEYIFSNDKIEFVLEQLGMHSIKWHGGRDYVTCGMPDGDNPSSTVIYNDSFLKVVAYTRSIEDAYGISDIISLVSFVRDSIFTQSISWLCEILGLDFYSEKKQQESSTGFFNLLKNMCNSKKNVLEAPLKPIPENTLFAYYQIANTEFEKDNISVDTQYEFELGIDVFTHRITIPVRDETGKLVGVKGRRVWDIVDEYNPKYIYLKQCAKSRICFGLYKTLPYIRDTNEIIVCEAEKGVMQLWTYGYKNCVSVGGHAISDWQQRLIVQSGAAEVIIAFDKDVTEDIIRKEAKKLSYYKKVYYIIDTDNILDEKESPMDDPEKWEILNSKYKKLYVEL